MSRCRVAIVAAFNASVGATEGANGIVLAASGLPTEVVNGSAKLWDDARRLPLGSSPCH